MEEVLDCLLQSAKICFGSKHESLTQSAKERILQNVGFLYLVRLGFASRFVVGTRLRVLAKREEETEGSVRTGCD